MTPAGYSGTPLPRKLGIKPGMRCVLLDAPAHYHDLLSDDLPDDVTFATSPAPGDAFVHLFTDRAAGLEDRLRGLRSSIARDGMVWVSWPRKASGVATDVTGDVVREAGLAAGLVDVKVCAVDETWSGLKFVIRRAERG